jgi:hypothetical protein
MALLKPVLFDPRKDMRAQARARLEVHGTLFLPEEKYEQKCLVLDLSPDGAGLKSTCTAALGTRVVLHVQNLGRYEGTLIRHDRIYVGVQFKFSEAKRARVAEEIAAYVEGRSSPLTSTRTNARIAAMTIPNKFSLASGETGDCEIIDIALSGVAFKAVVRPVVGEHLFFGNSTAVVVRHTEDGFAVAFSEPREAEQQ